LGTIEELATNLLMAGIAKGVGANLTYPKVRAETCSLPR
jgi:hypothetical protein